MQYITPFSPGARPPSRALILDIDAVARRADVEGILQLHSLLKLPLAERWQGPRQEHKWTAQVAEEHQPPELPPVLVSSSEREMTLVEDYLVELPSHTQICSPLQEVILEAASADTSTTPGPGIARFRPVLAVQAGIGTASPDVYVILSHFIVGKSSVGP
jgi:hypothetical protein